MTSKSVSAAEARKNLYALLKEVVDDAVPVVIRNRGRENVVMIPESEYNSLTETEYVTRGENGAALLKSMEEARVGHARTYSMEELRSMLDD